MFDRSPLIVTALLLAACTSTATSTLTATTPAPTTSAPATTTTTESTSATTVVLDTGPTGSDLAGAVFANTLIEVFAAHTEVAVSRDREGTQPTVSSVIDTVYQRDPAAVAMVIDLNGNTFSVITMDGHTWINQDGAWQESPLAEQVIALASVSLLSPETVALIAPRLTEVGEEDVAGRAAVHYQGGPESFDVLVEASTDLNLAEFTDLEYATIDLWIDKAGFLSKAEYRFGGTRGESVVPEYYVATFELTGFDLAVDIAAPQTP